MTIKIILKSGSEFAIMCDKFTIEKNIAGQITGYEIEGVVENKPVYLNFEGEEILVGRLREALKDGKDD